MALQFWQQQSNKSIPIPLANLILWHKGSDKILNGSNVSKWTDLSGTSHHATQSVAVSQPAWLASDVNGQPVVSSDNSNDFMEYPTGFLNGLTDISFFIVLNPTINDNGGIFAPSTTGSAGLELIGYDGGVLRINNVVKCNHHALYNNKYQLFDFTYNSSETSIYQNTIKYIRQTDSAPIPGGSALNYNGVYALFRYYASYYTADKIAEIIIYSSSLSASDRATVQNYLMKKYDLKTVTESGYTLGETRFADFTAKECFIPTTTYGWIANATTGYVLVRYYNAKSWSTYTLTAPATEMNRMAKDFTLQACNDGVNYAVIDTVIGSTAWGANEARTFTIDNPGSYLYYKLVITSNDGNGSYLQIKKIAFA